MGYESILYDLKKIASEKLGYVKQRVIAILKEARGSQEVDMLFKNMLNSEKDSPEIDAFVNSILDIFIKELLNESSEWIKEKQKNLNQKFQNFLKNRVRKK